MKGIKRLGATFFAALLIAACTEKDGTEVNSVVPFCFSTSVDGAQTRGTELNNSNLSSMGVFAYFTNGDFNASSVTPNYLYNEPVTKSGSDWTYTNIRYWPNNDTDKISFFAYAPHSATGVVCSDATTKGCPALTYTVPTTEAAQTDLLAATPLMNQTYAKTGGSVKFTMEHVLSRVKFSIKSEVNIKVTALTVNNVPATATLTFTDSGFSWGNYTSAKTTCNATLGSSGIEVTGNAVDAKELATFFLLPNKSSATFSITYIQDGNPALTITKSNIAFPTGDWTQKGSVNYQLSMKKDGTMTATVADNEWTSGSGGDMSGKEKGIGTVAEWIAFAKLWNENGLPTQLDGVTPDYTIYENYGWYEMEGANRVFTIKLTSPFMLTGVGESEFYEPVGTDSRPLTLPIDGQGWEIGIDLQNNSQLVRGEYSGIVGYTKSGISNLRVVTIPGNSASTGYRIESAEAIYAGVLAGRVEGDILNCSVELVKTTMLNSNTSTTDAMYLGGLVGYCGGNILNSAVYEGLDAAFASNVSFSKASTGSGIGGLAGGVASGKTVSNCYVQLSQLSKQDGETLAAGWLVGSKVGVSFNSCHYKSGGTATDCTPDDSSTEIVSFTDFTGLCDLLNAEVTGHAGWASWKEVKNAAGDAVEQVALDLYR